MTSLPPACSGYYDLDEAASHIGFAVRSGVTKVRGRFKSFCGAGYLDAERPARSRLALSVDAASLDTGNRRRDKHLRSRAFFDADEHPIITFTSTSILPRDDGEFGVYGDLAIKGVTRRIVVAVNPVSYELDSGAPARLEMKGRTHVRRGDWGVAWNSLLEGGGLLISPTVEIVLRLEAARLDRAETAATASHNGTA